MAEAKQELIFELKKQQSVADDDPDVAKVILLLGPHGCGKTAITRQACEEAGAEYAAYHHGATVEEDNHGLPVVEEKNGIKIVGQAKPKHLPCFFRAPESKTGRGALVLHEPFTGGIGHQNILRMMTERQHNSDSMFPGWILMATSNPETAEYVTVKSVDAALASRMVIIVVKPSDDEKLTYWSSRMHPIVYKFLLMTKFGDKKISIIEKLDSRSWYNLAHSIGLRHAANAPRESLVKLIKTHAGTDVSASFNAYLEHGDDPYYYPISARELVMADENTRKTLLARINQWITAQPSEIPLIGATNWDLGVWIREESDALVSESKNKNAVENLKSIAENLCAYMNLVGTNNHADLVDDLIQNARGKTVSGAVLKGIRGTKLEQRIAEIFQKYTNELTSAKESERKERDAKRARTA